MKFLLSSYICLLVLSGSTFGQNGGNQASRVQSQKEGTQELTSYQRISMYLGHSLFKAEPVKRQSEILWGIKGVKPMLEIAEGLQPFFETEVVNEKMLSVLKDKSVPIDYENGQLLLFRIRGVWDKGNITLLYTYDLDLVDKVYVSRAGQIKSNFRSVWNVSNMGFAGKDVVQNAMLTFYLS